MATSRAGTTGGMPRSSRTALTFPGPPGLRQTPCPIPVSQTAPGEQDPPRAAGEAEQKCRHGHRHQFGKRGMRLHL